MNNEEARARIQELARGEGFPLTRFASAEPISGSREAALARLREGRLEGLGWITDEWLTRATDPDRFLPGARSVVLVALPYKGSDAVPTDGATRGRVARYSRGRDYHRVFEKKLRRVAKAIRKELGAETRATVDYGPLLERPLAAAAGLGWLGKSTMLLTPGFGPWMLLGAVATDLDLRPDEPLKKTCGACTRCLVACPTGALSPEGNFLDARLCISYHTIENRGPIPRELRAKFGDWIFGCDDCLEACPVGATSNAAYPDLSPQSLDDARPALAELLALDQAGFEARYRGHAIMRTKRDGFLRNVCVALGNVGTAADLSALGSALSDSSPLVRGHAAWAVGHLGARLGSAAAGKMLADGLQVETEATVREELECALRELSVPSASDHC
ncbi:MAG TPA: tRNA epoxyqueuosine(34) reductase QueG [Tepidiformaceae bacterium]